ncbi:hypothetical protein CPC08DRAFT_708801 [Agrocybe pediades]|nr:hypothetical protein CPC08DRAFT_708801 [Agrocybe pediades]
MGAKDPNQKKESIPPKGKKVKRFLEKNDALTLAASIADDVEKKSASRSEKHKIQVEQPKADRKPISQSKTKLKEAKAALRARLLEAKKEKSKLRRNRFKDTTLSEEDPASQGSGSTQKPPRKKVSFA